MANNVQQRQQEFDVKISTLRDAKDVDFQELPEHSKRQYYREFRKVVESSDVILEVLDARDPIGCRTKSVEQMITSYGDKKVILVLNKIGKRTSLPLPASCILAHTKRNRSGAP